MTRRRNTDHVVIDTKTAEFWCRHCDARYKPAMPAPVDMFADMCDGFLKMHRACPAPAQGHAPALAAETLEQQP